MRAVFGIWRAAPRGGPGWRDAAFALVLTGLAGPVQAECLAFSRDIARVLTQGALEERLAAHLDANLRRFGGVDWECLEHAFTVLSGRTSVERRRVDGAVEYRFLVDRRGHPFAGMGGDGRRGVFEAVVRVEGDGRMRVGGEQR